MEKLWSPWRSNYIDSFKINKEENTCGFCSAIKQKISSKKSLIIYKADYSFIMLNLYPYNNGHLMIIPYRHISDFNELTNSELDEIMQLNKKAISALTLVMKPHGFNFGANLGQAAGAGIHEHLHFHLVPRWNGDTNFMPILGDVKVISQDLLETKKRLVDAIKNL